MSLPLSIRLEAELDVLASRDWYDRRRDGLGDDFVASLRELLLQIQDSPGLYAVGYRGVSQAKISRFPYIVYFRKQPESVEIIAVLHASRDPRIWPRRI